MHLTMPDGVPRKNQIPRRGQERRRTEAILTWTRSPLFGYLAGGFLVGALTLLEKIDASIPQAPLFTSAPFALVSILVALLWGTGPALLALVLGVLALVFSVAPGILTSDALRDMSLLGPFVLLQLISIATVIRLERSHRGLLLAHRHLELANHQLRRATHLKDYVMMRASHELRTPLTTILGRTQLLRMRLNRADNSPEHWLTFQTDLATLEARIHHMRSLIDSLFDLSCLQAEAIPFPLSPCDLGSLCREVVENQRVLSGRTIELHVPDEPLIIPADDKRLSQVLENLVSNAVRFSPATTPISLCAIVDDNDVILRVCNAAPMLSQEQREHLFDPFYRASGMEYSPLPGWGLGLTISKEIVERLGGQIWAEAPEEGKIALVVQLPAHESLPSKHQQ